MVNGGTAPRADAALSGPDTERRIKHSGLETEAGGILPGAGTSKSRDMANISEFIASRQGLFRDYLTAISGSVGRLVFSLVYFVVLANSLSIAEFGIFATASAAGVMLSRIVGFGFMSPLYRIATVKPHLIGTYTAGYVLMAALSLPALAAGAAIVYLLFFTGEISVFLFVQIMIAETILWRAVEAAVIVNNGMGRFGHAAVLVIIGTMLRMLAAILFAFWTPGGIEAWAGWYMAANAASLAIAAAVFYPRQRLRFVPRLYWRRLADAVYVSCAEVLFYLQMEFDKFLVLAIGGAQLAGIYAILMRLVDLTAIPIRTFSMMLVQRMMRERGLVGRLPVQVLVEVGIFCVSTAALLTLALILRFHPGALGSNVAQAAGLVALAICIPGFRNLVEYHAELLFARGQTGIRALNLALLAGAKLVLLVHILTRFADLPEMMLALNVAFGVLYLASALLTYSALRRPARAL